MSTLVTTNIQSANGTTDLTIKTGNTSGAAIIVAANGSGFVLQSNSTSNVMTVNSSAVVFTATQTYSSISATSSLSVGSNIVINTSTIFVGNSSVNATVFANSTNVYFTGISYLSNNATYATSSATNTFTVSTASYFVSNGNLGIGTNAPGAKLVISNNAVTPQTPISGTMLHIAAADSVASRITLDSYGTNPNFSFRRAQGTAASPTALITDSAITAITSFGYGATGYSATTRASLISYAAENWSDTAQGTYWTFTTTPTGSLVATERMRIDPSGNVGIGNTVPTEKLTIAGNVVPSASNTHDLGSTTLRWRNIYTNDLNLNNGIGDYTVVEGENDLFLYNNKKGKVYKFALIEVDPSEAPKKAQ